MIVIESLLCNSTRSLLRQSLQKTSSKKNSTRPGRRRTVSKTSSASWLEHNSSLPLMKTDSLIQNRDQMKLQTEQAEKWSQFKVKVAVVVSLISSSSSTSSNSSNRTSCATCAGHILCHRPQSAAALPIATTRVLSVRSPRYAARLRSQYMMTRNTHPPPSKR